MKNQYRFLLMLMVVFTVGIHAQSDEYASSMRDRIRFDSREAAYDSTHTKAREYYYDYYNNYRPSVIKPDTAWLLHNRKLDRSLIFKEMARDTIAFYAKLEDSLSVMTDKLASMRRKLGKPFSDNTEKEIAVSLLNMIPKEKDKNKAKKDIEKGKLSKKLSQPLEVYYKHYYEQSVVCYKKLTSISYYPENCPEKLVGLWEDGALKAPEVADVILTDTIPNPWYRKAVKLNCDDDPYAEDVFSRMFSIILKADMSETEWEWVEDKDNREEINESYPHPVSYYKYTAHPDYRVIEGDYGHGEDKVYDKEGNLIYVMRTYYYLYNLEQNEDIDKQLAIIAYNNNLYDIQSASAKTRHYVRTQLGLEDYTKKEKAAQDRAASAMASATLGYMKDSARYGNSRNGRRAQNKHAANFLGALLSGADSYDSDGANWMKQVRTDYWKIIEKGPYKIKRLSNTSFACIYIDENFTPVLEIRYTYTNKAPYKADKQTSVKEL